VTTQYHNLVQNSQTESFVNNAFDWLMRCDATPFSRAAPALHTSDLECFWIDTGLSETIKNVKLSFGSNKKRLGTAQTWSDLQKTQPVWHNIFMRDSSYSFQRVFHRNSVCLSVCHTGGSVKNAAR